MYACVFRGRVWDYSVALPKDEKRNAIQIPKLKVL